MFCNSEEFYNRLTERAEKILTDEPPTYKTFIYSAEETETLKATTSITINTSHMTREQIAELTTQIAEIMHKITPNQGYICLDESTPFTEEHAKALDEYIGKRMEARRFGDLYRAAHAPK